VKTAHLLRAFLVYDFSVRSESWISNYNKLRQKVPGTLHPGYLLHEAVQWSEIHKRWFFLPRRRSSEIYDKEAELQRGTNLLISCTWVRKSLSHDHSHSHSLTHTLTPTQPTQHKLTKNTTTSQWHISQSTTEHIKTHTTPNPTSKHTQDSNITQVLGHTIHPPHTQH